MCLTWPALPLLVFQMACAGPTSGSDHRLDSLPTVVRDFWVDIYRNTIAVNKKNLEISELTLKGLLITNLFVVETNYYNVLLAREQVKVQQKAVELGDQLLREVRRQVQVGTWPSSRSRQPKQRWRVQEFSRLELREPMRGEE